MLPYVPLPPYSVCEPKCRATEAGPAAVAKKLTAATVSLSASS